MTGMTNSTTRPTIDIVVATFTEASQDPARSWWYGVFGMAPVGPFPTQARAQATGAIYAVTLWSHAVASIRALAPDVLVTFASADPMRTATAVALQAAPRVLWMDVVLEYLRGRARMHAGDAFAAAVETVHGGCC